MLYIIYIMIIGHECIMHTNTQTLEAQDASHSAHVLVYLDVEACL